MIRASPGRYSSSPTFVSREAWQGKRYLQDLQRKLSGMLSPFQEARDFVVHLEIDGKPLELIEIAQRVRETALLKYTFEFDGEVFHMSGAARLDYLQPNKNEDQRILQSLCSRDGGKALYEFLATKTGKHRPPEFHLSERAGWFVEFGQQQLLDSLPRGAARRRFGSQPRSVSRRGGHGVARQPPTLGAMQSTGSPTIDGLFETLPGFASTATVSASALGKTG